MERSYFFDSTENDERIYNAADFARFHSQIIGNGVSNTANLPDLEVTAQNNMNVGLGAGYMFANGYMYENTSTLTLTHDTADSNNDRIDRVVIRFDANPEERSIKAVILKGTPANNPVPPSLTRDNYIYEMSVAQVRIIKGKSFIEQSQITDERANDAVCGYIPLHNIYRGLQINEHGMVTMTNQSYVEMVASNSLAIGGSSDSSYITTLIPIVPDIDRQGEVTNDVFTAKSDGVYQIVFLLRVDSNISTTSRVQAFARINKDTPTQKNVFLFNEFGSGTVSNYFNGVGSFFLNKGDTLELDVSTLRLGGNGTSTQRRLSIIKLS